MYRYTHMHAHRVHTHIQVQTEQEQEEIGQEVVRAVSVECVEVTVVAEIEGKLAGEHVAQATAGTGAKWCAERGRSAVRRGGGRKRGRQRVRGRAAGKPWDPG